MESGDNFVFCKPDFMWDYFASFESMKESGELCDIVFKAGNVTISAHRVILAAGIPYFKDMFTGTDVENKSLGTAMAQTDPQDLVSLINFVYTGKIEISTENMISLFTASSVLGLSEIQEACCEFISKKLSVRNVIKARKAAEDLSCVTLVEQADNYIAEHFREFSQTDDFVTMPFSKVKKLICDDYLSVEGEEEVFEAVMKWVESFDSERRIPLMPELLKGVRLPLLSPIYLFETVTSNENVRASQACRDLLDEVNFYMLLPEKRHLFRNFSTSLRHSYKKIYAVSTLEFGCTVKFYNTEMKTWSLLATNYRHDHFVDAIIHGENMYLFGGKIFGSFHLKKHEWKDLEPVHENTCGAGIVLHSDRIYVLGSSSYDLSRQISCYDIFQRTWQNEGHMIEHRTRPGVVSMGDSIYVVGGYPDGVSWDSGVHNSVEKYDPNEGNSHYLPSMLISRYWFGISALKDRIYVCGGCDKKKLPFNSAEVFNPGSNQWNLISSMNTSRYSVSLVTYNKKLYAVGGKKLHGKSTNTVEIYDPESDSWTFDVSFDAKDDSLISLRACTG